MSPDAISLRRALCLAISLGIAVLAGTAHGKNVKPPLPDWQALAFTCTTEQNPPVDPQADAWFLRARELERQDIKAHDAEMVRLYQMAADRGHYKAMLNLAGLYSRGIVVPRDEGKAVDLVERALKLNAPHAFYTMGVMLQQGIGVKQDDATALSYFRRAADLGNRYGQQATGEAIRDAFIKSPELERSREYAIAVQMLECALSQGLAEAGDTLGWHYQEFDVDMEKSLKYFQKAASLGHKDSLFHLYSMFRNGEDGVAKDPQRAACYDKLWYEAKAEPGRKFPDIDRLCPLPPPPARTGISGQLSPRVGLWHQADNPAVMFRASSGDTLPEVDGVPVQWAWEASPFEGSRLASGQLCTWPGTWACEDLPVGGRHFEHGEPFPEVEGRPVTWRLMPRV
ncbi:tetratricopeptide repeat protein [Pseudomonas aeruginosa]|uniref:tetratricopeptide repeat protein n=1 Tax=Pseudomonas aeruginosa TaxID=287 RepID=UPI001559079A|nr:tetratricopeptide repeat protein [Pseudomonas aeruginosa]NPW38126.1 sel1 repeat family protein [Pseudomonas aeruginosa]